MTVPNGGPSHDLTDSVIIASLHCRKCGYNLRGLSPRGQCPECGTDIWLTIQSTVDPAASRLPQLRNPRGVGDGLVIIMICWLAAWLSHIERPMAIWLDSLGVLGGARLAPWVSPITPIVGGLVGLMGLWGVWLIAPPPGKEPPGPVWRDVYLLGFGMGGYALLVVMAGLLNLSHAEQIARGVVELAMCLAAIMGLSGLSGILAVIGLRSREYRTSRGGRQSAQAMIAAIACGAVGVLLLLVGSLRARPNSLETLGSVVVVTSQIMLFIGAVYLVMNAWWIRKALRKPPPTLESLLAGPGSFK